MLLEVHNLYCSYRGRGLFNCVTVEIWVNTGMTSSVLLTFSTALFNFILCCFPGLLINLLLANGIRTHFAYSSISFCLISSWWMSCIGSWWSACSGSLAMFCCCRCSCSCGCCWSFPRLMLLASALFVIIIIISIVVYCYCFLKISSFLDEFEVFHFSGQAKHQKPWGL